MPPASRHFAGWECGDAVDVDLVLEDRCLPTSQVSVTFEDLSPRHGKFLSETSILTVETSSVGHTVDSEVLSDRVESQDARSGQPKIGIVTAKAEEFNACRTILGGSQWGFVPRRGAGRRYLKGTAPSADGGMHDVALSLFMDQGNNSAAALATKVLSAYPSIDRIMMVGIAGGAPNPSRPDEHVRLGDVIVSNRNGVVQYNLVKETGRI